MKEPQQRKLSAILFADIVGYTALMQSNEPLAHSSLQKFRTELKTKVSEYQGEIIQFYGDGCLATFNSSVDAVTCAKELQLAFLDESKVPVRIGLHAGDVVFREGNVIGDAVNVASRIESMGVSGAVLLSSNVRNQIKNQPDLESVSLGRFEFKNVEEGMTVYALKGEKLTIPKKGEIKGKLKAPIKPKFKKRWLWSLPILLIPFIFGLHQWYQPANINKIQAEILKERIAVIPFENQTNDADLDIMGVMASDWLTRGLMRIENATIVSPNTVTQHLDAVGILPNNKEGKISFSELTGAKTILRGKYFRENEEIIFHLVITDADFGNILYSFNPIRGSLLEKEKTIDLLTEKMTGFWATKDDILLKKHKAPKYEAYKAYLTGLQVRGYAANAFQETLKAIELDSTFYLPRLQFIYWNSEEIEYDNAPHLAFIERHKDELSFYEHKFYDFLRGFYEGNYLYAHQNIEVLRNKYPKDIIINTYASLNCLWGLRNPNLGLTIGEELNISNFNPIEHAPYYGMWVGNRIWALNHLKEYREAIDFYESLPQDYHSNEVFPLEAYLYSLIGISKSEEVFKILNRTANNPEIELNAFGIILTVVGRRFLVADQPENAKEVAKIFRSILHEHREQIPFAPIFDNAVLELSGDWEAIANIPYKQYAPYPFYSFVLGSKGRAYIRTNQLTKVQEIFEELDSYYAQNIHRNAAIRSTALYTKGVLYAQLGNKEKAVQYLKESLEDGIHNNNYPFELDPNLNVLKGYAPYEELLKPVWPTLKG